MFKFMSKDKDRDRDSIFIDEEIERIEIEMKMTDLGSEEYNKLKHDLEDLINLKSQHKSWSIDPNTLLKCGCEIAGILIIVGYEYGHVLTSKALNRVTKI